MYKIKLVRKSDFRKPVLALICLVILVKSSPDPELAEKGLNFATFTKSMCVIESGWLKPVGLAALDSRLSFRTFKSILSDSLPRQLIPLRTRLNFMTGQRGLLVNTEKSGCNLGRTVCEICVCVTPSKEERRKSRLDV